MSWILKLPKSAFPQLINRESRHLQQAGKQDETNLLQAHIFVSFCIILYLTQDCGWADWSPWNGCSVTCGGGNKTRTRGTTAEDLVDFPMDFPSF
jgi:hypothetical protein